MLTVGSVLIPDLRLPENLAGYTAEIDRALRLLGRSGERGRDIVDVLVHSSHDLQDNRAYPSWEVAVSRVDLQFGPAGSVPQTRPSGPAALAAPLAGPGMAGPGMAGQHRVTEAFGRWRLPELLSGLPAAGSIRLFDCSFPHLHTFLIEVHPDGRRYLHQSYRGRYGARWWQGTDETALAGGQVADEQDAAALRRARYRYGLGKPIPAEAYARFVRTLNEAVLAGDWAGFATYWRDLPFCPTRDEEASVRSRGQAPVLEVSTYTVTLPADEPAGLAPR
jgi:hypothetical protein